MPHPREDSAECRALRPAFEPGAAAMMGIGVFPSSPTDEWWTMLRADLADEETVEERHSSLLADPAVMRADGGEAIADPAAGQ